MRERLRMSMSVWVCMGGVVDRWGSEGILDIPWLSSSVNPGI